MKLLEGKKLAIAQGRNDPTGCNLDAVFHRWLVLGLKWSGRQNDGAIIGGHFVVGFLYDRTEPVRFAYPSLEVVWRDGMRNATQILKSMVMGRDPVGQGFVLENFSINDLTVGQNGNK